MVGAETQNDDFDPKQAYTKISASLEQPDKFAEIFCAAAKTQKSIDTILKNNVRELLQHDNETRSEIKGMLREIEKEDWKRVVKKIGFSGWTIIVAATSAIVTLIGRHFAGN